MPLITDPSDPTESALEVRASGGQSAAILKVTDEHGVELGTFDKHGVVFSYPVMARRFWSAVFVLATLTVIPGGLLAYLALKHLLPLLPSGHPLTAKAQFRPQAWERMN